MALDPGPLGVLAAELMEEISIRYGDEAELVDGMVIVEVHQPDGDDGSYEILRWASIGDRHTADVGMVERVRRGLDRQVDDD